MGGNVGLYSATAAPRLISSIKNQIELTGGTTNSFGGNFGYTAISLEELFEANLSSCQNTFTPSSTNLGGKKKIIEQKKLIIKNI